MLGAARKLFSSRILFASRASNYNTLTLTLLLSALSLTMAQENAARVVKANNDLTNKLYAEITKPNENVFFSPLSLHTVLSLVYQGSKAKTESTLRSVLGLDDKLKTADGYENVMAQLNNVPNVTLEIANKVYVKEGHTLKPSFKAIATKSFFAEAENLNFEDSGNAAKAINSWVEQKTKDKIKNLIQAGDLDSLTRLVLINAIYFKGDWEDKFHESATTTEKFYTSATDSVDCKMMHNTRKYNYKEVPELDAKVLQIPYKNKDVSMVVILPNKRDGIADLEKKLANFDLQTLTDGMDYVEVQLSLPKFKMETTIALNDPLKRLGLENAFSNEADFSDMLESKEGLKISKVIQKAFIEVNEEGSEAAAATGVIMMMRCMPMQIRTLDFVADHPFVFHLQQHQNVLFQGKLAKA